MKTSTNSLAQAPASGAIIGTTKTLGVHVEDYSTKPNGNYEDTVTFTAEVENAVTTRTVTFSTSTDGNTINKDGVTCTKSFDSYTNLFAGVFTTETGKFTKIEVTAQDVSMTGMNDDYEDIGGWAIIEEDYATWTGSASSVNFGNIMGNQNPVTIVFTIEE